MTEAIPAQPLDSALQQLANQADLQLVYETDLAVGVNSPEVRGDLSVRSALDRLLQGTGLRYEADSGTWRVAARWREPERRGVLEHGHRAVLEVLCAAAHVEPERALQTLTRGAAIC